MERKVSNITTYCNNCRKSRLTHQALQREEFDKLVKDWETLHILPTITQNKLNNIDAMHVDSSPNENGKKALDSESLRLLLRKILFFFREQFDQERLDKVALLLLENLRNYSKLQGFLSFFENLLVDAKLNFAFLETPQSVALYGLQVKKFLGLAIKRFPQRLDIYLQIVLYFTTPDLVILTNSLQNSRM